MCTAIILRRPGHNWPLIIAANRDEMKTRQSLNPARHWPERSHVIAGMDQKGGGTWLALGDNGLISTVLNRENSLGPSPEKRSRGELPLEAMDHAEARVAANALELLEPTSYRAFNLIIADSREAFWLRSDATHIYKAEIPKGLSMVANHDLNDTDSSERIRFYLPHFRAASPPDPESNNWRNWETLLASTKSEDNKNYDGALNVETEHGFGTVSSSILALPAQSRYGVKPIWRFCAGPPKSSPYIQVIL